MRTKVVVASILSAVVLLLVTLIDDSLASSDVQKLDVPSNNNGVYLVRVEVSEPEPIDEVMMLSSLGHFWHRNLLDNADWELKSVTFDAKNFKNERVVIDSVVVKVADQIERMPIQITLDPSETKIVSIPLSNITDVASGDYPLSVSLCVGGIVVSERQDIASVYSNPKGGYLIE